MRNKQFPNYPDDTDYTTNAPSYYDDLARKEKLIRLLAERIWGYEKILDDTLEEIQERFRAWDKNLEDFPEDVKILLQQWLDDGTLDHIINDTIFNWKLDTAIFEQFRDSTTAQLQHVGNYFLMDYGAKCDDVTDDSAAWQALFNAVTHKKFTIIVPSGASTVINNLVTIPDGKIVYIVGNNATLKTTNINTPMFTSVGESYIKFINVAANGYPNGTAKFLTTGNVRYTISTYDIGLAKHVNPVNSTDYLMELENYSGQDDVNLPDKTAMVIHNYADGRSMQIDNVGNGDIIHLVNARNFNRRPLQPENHKGTGKFLVCEDIDTGELFNISSAGNLNWNVSRAIISNNKADDGFHAFQFKAKNEHAVFLSFLNGPNTVLEVTNLYTKVDTLRLVPTTSASVTFNSLFVDSADGNKLKFMDAAGAVKTVNLT